MDNSTDGVTLLSGFIFDVTSQYQDKIAFAKLCEMTKGLDPQNPGEWVPISLYNYICDWVETNVGVNSVRRAGKNIGKRAYDRMVADRALGKEPSPSQILGELKRVASLMIRDPKNRGWEIVKDQPRHIVMRRTQTFNCMLQEGLLRSLIMKTTCRAPTITHVRCTRQSDKFCEYEIRWL